MTSTPLLAFFTGMPGGIELLIVGFVILLLFGNRLPSVMRSLGRGVVEFKHGLSGVDDSPADSDATKSESEAESVTQK